MTPAERKASRLQPVRESLENLLHRFDDLNLDEIEKALEEATKLVGNISGSVSALIDQGDGVEFTNDLTSQLEIITEGRYMSVDRMNEVLRRLRGVNVYIPEGEIATLKSFTPDKISEDDMRRLKALKDQTEGNKGPLMMQLPKKIIVDGQEKDFTIRVVEEIMNAVANQDSSFKPLKFSEFINEYTTDIMTWNRGLTVWSSACLVNSKDRPYSRQLDHQKSVLGEDYKIGADVILAIALRYMDNREALIEEEFMRLNQMGSDNLPCCISIRQGLIKLHTSSKQGASDRGIGASFKISS